MDLAFDIGTYGVGYSGQHFSSLSTKLADALKVIGAFRALRKKTRDYNV